MQRDHDYGFRRLGVGLSATLALAAAGPVLGAEPEPLRKSLQHAGNDLSADINDFVRKTTERVFEDTSKALRPDRPTFEGPAARGVVFEDFNRNGVRDNGEHGINNVLVSNGVDVVKTRGNGEYVLPVRGDAVLFVIKPAGYAVPTDENQIPRFYYIHQPQGTPSAVAAQIQARAKEYGPEVSFDVVAATGELPASVDFPLYRSKEDDEFKAILIADPQPQRLRHFGLLDKEGMEVNYVRDDFVARAAGIDAKLGITHGDIMFDDLSLFHRQNAAIGQLGVPWLNVVGNHDMNFVDMGSEAANDKWSLETFKAVYGPTYYAYEYADTMFIVLDNVYYLGPNYRPGLPTGAQYKGNLTPEQITFVRNLLEHVDKNKLIVISTHIPLDQALSRGAGGITDNRAELLKLVCEREHRVAIAGHTHRAEHLYLGADSGCQGKPMHHHIIATVSGAWWSGPFDERGIPTSEQVDGTPNGFYLMHVKGNKYYNQYIPMEKPKNNQMRILLESATHPVDREDVRPGENFAGNIPQSELGATKLVVNLFDGGPRSEVSFEIVGRGESMSMARVVRKDPFIEELYGTTAPKSAATPDGRKPWVRASDSTHIWQASMPVNLPKGTHAIRVKATDEFGRSHVMEKMFEVM